MKVLYKLAAAESKDLEFRDSRGILTAVHCEPQKGCLIAIKLGQDGLVISRGDIKVAIPRPELLRLAADHQPDLLPAPPSTSPNP